MTSIARGGDAEKTAKAIDFEIPSWSGKPPAGYHLDVLKIDKLIQKLMIDEKRCYFFGRNPEMCDFTVDHASCSRVHAALVYHKFLSRFFLIDLGSTHGTHIGKLRLEAKTPQQILPDQSFHFGASTRRYILRERPSSRKFGSDDADDLSSSVSSRARKLLGLPEKEEELDNLTEYNTALNRRIVALPSSEELKHLNTKRKSNSVCFNDDEQVINPEDVDPSIGRFRNLVHTAIIPTKKAKLSPGAATAEGFLLSSAAALGSKRVPSHISHPEHPHAPSAAGHLVGFGPLSSKLGLMLPNPAPEPELYEPSLPPPTSTKRPIGPDLHDDYVPAGPDEPKKKIYAKEAWPGRKRAHLLV